MFELNSIDVLSDYWQNTVKSFDCNLLIANQVLSDIFIAYSHPSRYYHTLNHIYSVLKIIENLHTNVQQLSAVKFAAWFHDVVYDTHKQDNEEKSAEYAINMLEKLEIPQFIISQVKHLIMCTKSHQANDIDSQVLLAADLAIFAASPSEYQVYTKAIRQEYAWVNDIEYMIARRQVLENFLQRQHIYFTPMMRELYEEIARCNIKKELQYLS